MLNWSMKLVMQTWDSAFVQGAMIVASLNMLIQIVFDFAFGYKNNMKLRGDRGE